MEVGACRHEAVPAVEAAYSYLVGREAEADSLQVVLRMHFGGEDHPKGGLVRHRQEEEALLAQQEAVLKEDQPGVHHRQVVPKEDQLGVHHKQAVPKEDQTEEHYRQSVLGQEGRRTHLEVAVEVPHSHWEDLLELEHVDCAKKGQDSEQQ